LPHFPASSRTVLFQVSLVILSWFPADSNSMLVF
jgi:hypothetical protein